MNSKPAERAAAPVLVRGGRVLNVFTGELLEQDILIEGERIKAVIPRQNGEGDPGRPSSAGRETVFGEAFGEIIDVAGRVVVPGYVEPHAHVGIVAEPIVTLEQMARTGTTAVVADTYGFMVPLPDEELGRVLDAMQQVPTYVRWFFAPHARSFLVDEDEQFSVERVERFLIREDVVAIGELTRWPVVEQGDPDLVEKIERTRRAGKRVEGHGAGASAPRLQRLLWHGVTSDHEGITPEQVLERVRLGFYTMLRHSSLRPDLPALLRVFDGELAGLQHSNRIMLTADGPTPVWVNAHGYLDHLIRLCIEGGLEPAAAYRMATLNPAMYYRIEGDVGAIAPGRRADLNVLHDLTDPTPALVIAGGRVVAEEGELVESFPRVPWDELEGMARPPGRIPKPALFEFGDGGSRGVEAIPTLNVAHTVLLRLAEAAEAESAGHSAGMLGEDPAARTRPGAAGLAGDPAGHPSGEGPARPVGAPAAEAGVPGEEAGAEHLEPLRVAVYDWHGRWMTRAFVKGFVDRLGGLATSYSAAYQVTVMGQNADDMAAATARVLEAGGGLCLVEDGEEVFWLPLERAGLFNELPWSELVAKLAEFETVMRERGYRGHELLYALFFFGFDSLPDYRLTVRGVWDVRRHKVLAPPLQL